MLNPEELIEKYRELIRKYEDHIKTMEAINAEYFSQSIEKLRHRIKNTKKAIRLLRHRKGYRKFKKRLQGGEGNGTRVCSGTSE